MRKHKYIWKAEQVLCILLPSKTVQRIRSKNKLPRSIYIRGYSPLCSYLKTKESYDRWVTRRLWGFRYQISKVTYLKMSIAHIGDFDIKYLKQNISRCRSKISQDVGRKYQEASEEHRDTVYWKKNSPGKRCQRIRICLTGRVETSFSPIRLWDIRIALCAPCHPGEGSLHLAHADGPPCVA